MVPTRIPISKLKEISGKLTYFKLKLVKACKNVTKNQLPGIYNDSPTSYNSKFASFADLLLIY